MTDLMRRTILATLLAAVVITSVATPVLGASGNQGYAVYRNGVFFGYEWHAALMDDPHYNSTSLPIIHTPGGSSYVKWDSWSNFKDGKTYMGTYRPKRQPTSSQRDDFLYSARKLKDDQIPYTVDGQVDYNVSTAGGWVDASEITKIRCDGVIEYVFEYSGFRVYGDDSHWNVVAVGSSNRSDHWGYGAGDPTQRKQAESYLTKVTSSLP